MGISSLRRYHKPLESTEAAAVDPGPTETPEEAEAARLANEAKLAAEQAAQAAAANEHPNATAATEVAESETAESVNPIIQEAGGVEAGPSATIPTHAPGVESQAGAEFSEVKVGEPVTVEAGEVVAGDNTPSTNHGELERPTRFGSKVAWLAYVEADPAGAAEGYESLNRDQLAELYLGPKG